MACVMCMHTGN